MRIPLSQKLLSVFVASALFLCPIPSVQASESADDLTVTIDRTAQFSNPEGEDVLVPAGIYAVRVGNEQFTLTEGTGTPINIATTEWLHTTEIPSPTMVFVSSEDGQIPQRHLLVLYYPDGKTIQALGTDPMVTSRGTQGLPSEYGIDPALVTFEQSVHFTAPDGTPVVVQPGTYTAEAAEQAIRFIPSGDSQNTLLIEARQGTHDLQLEVLLAVSLPGTTPKELDLNYLMLLLPTGESLEAIGSYSGIQTRGLLSGAFNKAKRGIKSGASAVGSGASAVGKATGKVVIGGAKAVGNVAIEGGKVIGSGVVQAGKGLEQGAKLTWDGTKWVVKQVGAGAKIAFCFTTVGALKAGKAAAGFMGDLIPTAISNKTNMVSKLTGDLAFRNSISKKISDGVNANRHAIPELKRIQEWMKNPSNKAKLEAIFSINNFCKDSLGAMDAKLKSFGLAPNFAMGQPQASIQPQPQVQPQITLAMVSGEYRHNPVQNDWHIGSIVPDGAGLRWTNKAGASWHLTPDLANQRLLAQGTDNPYAAQGLREFKLVISNGQITGFQFGGGTYLRETAPTQLQGAIISRDVETPGKYFGYAITLDGGKGIGIVGGLFGVTNFKGRGGKYWFLGAEVGIFVGAGGVIQFIYFPKVDLASFEGMGWGLGGSLGKVVTFAADGIFDERFNLQGFGVGVGGGVGSKAIGDIAVSWDWSWKY